jgi:hypothetical protein
MSLKCKPFIKSFKIKSTSKASMFTVLAPGDTCTRVSFFPYNFVGLP